MNQSIFNLALDFFRSPGAHDELVDPASPLPPDISSLLDVIAGEQDPSIENPVVVSDEMRAAIVFLIERSFFVDGANFYRLLGLNRDASGEQVKKHYNQLMRVFLLKKEDQSGSWHTDHAIQINRAYSVLRDTEQRRVYDQQLQRQMGGREKPVPAHVGKSEKISYFPSQGEPAQTQASASSAGAMNQESGSPRGTRLPYVAHSIDRVSSTPVAPSIEQEEAVLMQAGTPPPVSPESWDIPGGGGGSEAYPKAIPMPEPSRHHHSPVKAFFKSTLAVALLATVLVAFAVYFLGTPSVLMEETPEKSSSVENTVESRTGSVAQGEETNTASNAEVDASNLASTAPASIPVGADGSTDEVMGEQTPPEIAPQAGVSQDKVGVDAPARPPTGLPPVGKPVESASKLVQAAPGKAAAGKSVTVQDQAAALAPGKTGKRESPESSPAKRLEAMRPPESQDKVPAGVPPVAIGMPGLAETGGKPAASTAPAADVRAVEGRSTVTADKTARLDSDIAAGNDTVHAAGPAIDKEVLAVPPVLDVPVAVVPPAPGSTAIDDGLRGELDALLTRFSQAYEAGTLPQLLALFAADAKTNDQSDIKGIEKDYRELFSQTDRRAFVFERMQWKRDGDNAFVGQGVFHVYVKLKDQVGSNALDGRITFHIQKRPQGLLITRMVHDYE